MQKVRHLGEESENEGEDPLFFELKTINFGNNDSISSQISKPIKEIPQNQDNVSTKNLSNVTIAFDVGKRQSLISEQSKRVSPSQRYSQTSRFSQAVTPRDNSNIKKQLNSTQDKKQSLIQVSQAQNIKSTTSLNQSYSSLNPQKSQQQSSQIFQQPTQPLKNNESNIASKKSNTKQKQLATKQHLNNSSTSPSKLNYVPAYQVNQKRVPKDTFFAFRSISPCISDSHSASATFNQNSSLLALSKNQNQCGKQLLRLAQERFISIEQVMQQESDKQQIFEIDQRLHSSRGPSSSNVLNEKKKNMLQREQQLNKSDKSVSPVSQHNKSVIIPEISKQKGTTKVVSYEQNQIEIARGRSEDSHKNNNIVKDKQISQQHQQKQLSQSIQNTSSKERQKNHSTYQQSNLFQNSQSPHQTNQSNKNTPSKIQLSQLQNNFLQNQSNKIQQQHPEKVVKNSNQTSHSPLRNQEPKTKEQQKSGGQLVNKSEKLTFSTKNIKQQQQSPGQKQILKDSTIKQQQQSQPPQSHEKCGIITAKKYEWGQFEKTHSPAQRILDSYLLGMKAVERQFAKKEEESKKSEIVFNNQYFKVLKCSGQIKTPIEIVDNSLQYVSMYPLAYNAYSISVTKRSFPWHLEVQMEEGDLEIFVGRNQQTNWNNYDFYACLFDVPMKINYQRGEAKDSVYINIFSKIQSFFQFKLVSSESQPGGTGQGNNSKNQQNQVVNNRNSNHNSLKNPTDKTNQNQRIQQSSSQSPQQPPKKIVDYNKIYKSQLQRERIQAKEQHLIDLSNTEASVVIVNQGQNNSNNNSLKNSKSPERKQFSNITRKPIVPFGASKNSNLTDKNGKKQINILSARQEKQEVRIVRAQYVCNLNKLQNENRGRLQLMSKTESKSDQSTRVARELRQLKCIFQHKWLSLMSLVWLAMLIRLKLLSARVMLNRRNRQTHPMQQVAQLAKNYLTRTLGENIHQRTLTRVNFCLGCRSALMFQTIKAQSVDLIVYFSKEAIKSHKIKLNMLRFYKQILGIQSGYRQFCAKKNASQLLNIKRFDIAFSLILEEEQKFITKHWIQKPIFAEAKKRIEKHKIKALQHFHKASLTNYFVKISQYKQKMEKLPKSHQIAYAFCSATLHSYFHRKYNQQVADTYEHNILKNLSSLGKNNDRNDNGNGRSDHSAKVNRNEDAELTEANNSTNMINGPKKKTVEHYIERLKFMVRLNVYVLLNNPIVQFEKEKLKLQQEVQLKQQKKQNDEENAGIQQQQQKQQNNLKRRSQMPHLRTSQETPTQSSDSSVGSESSSKNNIALKTRASKVIELKIPLQGNVNIKPRNSRNQEQQIQEQVARKSAQLEGFQDYIVQEEKRQEAQLFRRLSRVQESPFNNQIISKNTSPNKIVEEKLKRSIEIKVAEDLQHLIGSSEPNSNQQIIIDKVEENENILEVENTNTRKSIITKQSKRYIDQSSLEAIISGGKKNSIFKTSSNQDLILLDQGENISRRKLEERKESQDDEDEEDGSRGNSGDITSIQQLSQQKIETRRSRHIEHKISISMPKRSKHSVNSIEDITEKEDEGSQMRLVIQQQQNRNSKKSKFQSVKNLPELIKSENQSCSSNSSIDTHSLISSSINNNNYNNNQSNSQGTFNNVNNSSPQNVSFIKRSDSHTSFVSNQPKEPTSVTPLSQNTNTNKTTKAKPKKKKPKKKKVVKNEEEKLEEIVEGDEAIQTFWANFIHQPIFTCYPSLIEMKELIVKIQKKL